MLDDTAPLPPRRMNKLKVVSLIVLLPIALLLLYQVYLFLMVCWYSVQNPTASAVMRQTIEELRSHDPAAAITHQWVAYADISNNLKRAVIASEDSNFINHEGIEWEAIRRALAYNRSQAEKGSALRRGGSTITQQVAKNLFLSNSRSYWRKGQELVLSYMIETVMSKERILEIYLNIAQWGTTTFGAEAAARHYFRVGANQLTPRQAANLAAMLPNPIYYDTHRNTRYLNSRTNTIQQRMRLVQIP
ncbi:monofunctional biosynthetic peptidoglycan transglycosylase [Paenalcaligenes sp. Me131]|uniref:monofunctional biosynthetic peptidoglycan transglycosylase n=1 Tax=Paenalcaligenes sp. Me131 TaxID=3392636 RepID=UPI003D29F343